MHLLENGPQRRDHIKKCVISILKTSQTDGVNGGVVGPARAGGGQGAGLMARRAGGSERALMAGSGARAEARMAKSEAEVHLRDPRDPRE